VSYSDSLTGVLLILFFPLSPVRSSKMLAPVRERPALPFSPIGYGRSQAIVYINNGLMMARLA